MRTVAASLIGAALLLSACGDGGGGGAGPPDGSRRIEKGGVRIDVPSSMRERPVSAPGIVAAGPGDVPDQPRLLIAADKIIGSFGPAVADSFDRNAAGLRERRIVVALRDVKVPGARAARQGEWTFLDGGKGGTPAFTSHVWERYAQGDDGRIYALTLVVPPAAAGSVDVDAVLDSFVLT
jgi:hypothetical protein